MNLITKFLSFLSVLVFPLAGWGALILDSSTYNGSDYHLVGNSGGAGITWTDAQAFAVTLGGNLATINDQAENDHLGTLWGGVNSLWIGLNDVNTPGQFEWVSGEPVTFTNWDGNEPNNSGGNEQYVHLWDGILRPGNQTWNDLANETSVFGRPLYGVVEIPTNEIPEPRTIAAFSLVALAGFLYYRRRKAA